MELISGLRNGIVFSVKVIGQDSKVRDWGGLRNIWAMLSWQVWNSSLPRDLSSLISSSREICLKEILYISQLKTYKAQGLFSVFIFMEQRRLKFFPNSVFFYRLILFHFRLKREVGVLMFHLDFNGWTQPALHIRFSSTIL